MVDYSKHVHKTGIDRVLAEQEIRHDEWRERDQSSGIGSGSTRVPKSAEEHVADIVLIVIWGGVSYYGIAQLDAVWYWPVGVGLATGVIMQKLPTTSQLTADLQYANDILARSIICCRNSGT